MTGLPTGPSRPLPMASRRSPRPLPRAPPQPISLGQKVVGRGSMASRAARAGMAISVATLRSTTWARGLLNRRQAQASSASTGSSAARPTVWISRSEAVAPAMPTQLVGWLEVAVSSDGSCGS